MIIKGLHIRSLFLLLLFILPGVVLADAEKIFKENPKSVVLVTAYNNKGQALTEGTGFIASADGAIVTNYHVVGIAKDIKVKAGNRELAVEGVLYSDRGNDLVILKTRVKDLPAVRPGEVVRMKAGDAVYLISSSEESGAAVHEGVFNGITMTSANRKVLQITARASHGSSGSPVFNKKGEVIGITTFLIKRSQNIILAMPVDLIQEKIKNRKMISLAETVKNYRKTADYWFYLGYFLAEAGAHKEAAEVLREAIRLRPALADAHYYLGISYEQLKKNKEAVRAYKEAVRLMPDLTDAFYSLGVLYGKQGMYKESADALTKTVRLEPDFADAYYNMGVAYEKLGMHKEGIEANRQAVKLRPDFVDAYYNLGIAYEKSGDYKGAVSPLREAVRLKPDFAEAHYNLGIVYLLLKDQAAALERHGILKALKSELAGKLLKLIYS